MKTKTHNNQKEWVFIKNKSHFKQDDLGAKIIKN